MLKEQLISQQELFESLANGASVLTGNKRLARDLISRFDSYNISKKKKYWSSPNVVPINTWLIQNWEQALVTGKIPANKILLNFEQEFHVWQSIISASVYGNGLLRIAATAQSVSETWAILQQWNLTHHQSDFENNDDTKAFHYWATEFEKTCQKQNWITIAELGSANFHSRILQNQNIILLGFDELSPQYHLLFNNIVSDPDLKCRVRWLRQNNKNKSQQILRLQCNDVRSEIESFVLWAKQQLVDNPDVRIGLVAPNLSPIRQILIQTLERILLPASTNPVADPNKPQSTVWDISLGLPLANHTLIKLIFQLLRLVHGKISIEILSCVLGSNDLNGAIEELNQRALLDRFLRQQGEQFVSLQTVNFYASDKGKPYYCPIFSNIVNSLIELRATYFKSASSQEWADWISKMLLSVGWAAARVLDSEQYQIIESWKSVLHSFTSLQIVCKKMSLEQAVICLQRLSSEKIFQVQSNSAPIRILGMYESIGLSFDHLWVMGLYDEVWPVSPRTNPFIPIEIQNKYCLPHANWQRELQVAQKITNRLEDSAKNIIFSYPEKNGILSLRMSPLIKDYHETTLDQLILEKPTSWFQLIVAQSSLDEITDDSVTRVEMEKISGGSSIFKNQSLCPFKALVENRLHAKPMRKTQLGLDAMKRGSLIHSVLELFWTVIIDQEQLKSKSTDELEKIINQCIDQAITVMSQKTPATFTEKFTQLEKTRLNSLMKNWIEIELQRAPFKVVDIEREINIDINGVVTRLFIDRVDEIDNGRQMIIDYKSGSVSVSDWFGERPVDPQLPLYSIAAGKKIAAVLFAQLNNTDMKFSGVVEQKDLIPNLPPSRKGPLRDATDQWPAVLESWLDIINRLAHDFVNAHIEVDPKDGIVTCQKLYCELSALCRINELIAKNDSTLDIEP